MSSNPDANVLQDEYAIRVSGVSKHFQIYETPRDRLKQFIMPRLQRMFGQPERQYFREFAALENVSFTIRKGETVGIIGRNGAGKSTLLQIICGTLTPTAGSIDVNGRVAALLELGSGFNTEFSGRENIYLNAGVLGLSKEKIDEKFDDIVAFADIGEFLDQPVKTYSSGMYVRLAFAVIAHVDADILVIDEALAVGDVYFTQKCMRFLKKFQETGSVIFVTHDTSSVLALCEKAAWLNKGRLLGWGDAKSICESYLNDYYSLNRESKSALDGQDKHAHYRNVSVEDFRDCRQDLINASTIRNDLEFSIFSKLDESSYGAGQVTVEDVYFRDPQGQPIKWFVGGELVELKVVFKTDIDLSQPIVGFLVKDKLGQALFGENTFINYADRLTLFEKGSIATASFTFRMPVMPAGEYTVGVAVANGTQEEHIMHTWLHDALVIKSHSKNVATGLLGIPMLSIEMGRYVN